MIISFSKLIFLITNQDRLEHEDILIFKTYTFRIVFLGLINGENSQWRNILN